MRNSTTGKRFCFCIWGTYAGRVETDAGPDAGTFARGRDEPVKAVYHDRRLPGGGLVNVVVLGRHRCLSEGFIGGGVRRTVTDATTRRAPKVAVILPGALTVLVLMLVLFHDAMVRTAETSGSGWVDYMFPKPGQTEPSRKRTYVKAVTIDGVSGLVGSGFYPD
jgi:hypothetical protein